MSTISLVTLPRGRVAGAAGKRLRWAVYFSMRLDADTSGRTTLAAFPALADWPALLASATFAVEVAADDAASGVHCEVRPAEPADSRLWQRLFPPALPVHPFADGSEAKEQVVRAVRSDTVVRMAGSVLQAVRESGERSETARARLTAFANCRMSGAAVPLEKLAREWPADPLEQFGLLHSAVEANAIEPGDETKPTDFHRALSAVQEYPALLRKLGLTIDFESELAGVEIPVTGKIRTIATIDAAGLALTSPWTAYETQSFETASLDAFHARRAPDAPDSRVAAGMVVLGHEDVLLSQLNTSHAVLSLGEFARKVTANDGTELPPEFPAQFTSGVALLDPRGPEEIRQSIARRNDIEPLLFGTRATRASGRADVVLYADDIVLGYRVDVCADGKPWRSLCARSVSLSHAGTTLGAAIVDEGYVAPAANRSETDKLVVSKVHSALFDWDGWSLVVPRPGKSLDERGAASPATTLEDPNFPLHADFRVPPGSLEPLRYGTRYRFRARVVDLSGASLSGAEADAIVGEASGARFVSDSIDSARYEPIAAPLVVPATEPGHGEGDALFAVGNETLDGGPKKTTKIYIAPPRASLATVERHGALDEMSHEQSYRYISSHQQAFPTQHDPHAFAQLLSNRLRQLKIPYLSDPLAYGVVFLDLPGARGPVGPVAFPREHGERYTVGLTLEPLNPGAKPRAPKLAGSDVTVYLPAGETHSVRLLCVPLQDKLAQLANAVDRANAHTATHEKLYARVLAGEAPFISPPLALDLVHAVQRPVAAPTFGTPALTRALGSRGATLADAGFRVHEPSTARVDFVATWRDFVEADVGWLHRLGRQTAFGVDVKDGDENPLLEADTAHAFPDRRFHAVAYEAIATSRYRDFYTSDNPSDYTITSTSSAVGALATAAPAEPEPAYAVPTFRWSTASRRRPFRVQRKRLAGGLRIYMQRSWFSSGNDERLGLVLAPDANGPVDPTLEPFVTTWGTNPIKPSQPLPTYPGADDLTDTRHEVLPFAVPAEWTDGQASGGEIAVASYRVEQEPRRKLLYCDIELDPRGGFLPMVQLALLRHQPNALPGAELSRCVRVDSALLLPERSLTVERSGDRIAIVLVGVSYAELDGDHVATSRVVARLETRDRRLRGDDLGWEPVGTDVVLDAAQSETGEMRWSAELAMPTTNDAMRVVIVERIPLPADVEGARLGNDGGRPIFADAILL